MGIRVIHTADGDKLWDDKSKKLAGSVPKKPRVPKVAKILSTSSAVPSLSDKAQSDVQNGTIISDSVTKARTIFTSLRMKPPSLASAPVRYDAFWRYGDDGDQKPAKMAVILHEHIIRVHSPSENLAEGFEKTPHGEEIFDNFNRWHEDLHALELDNLLLNDEVEFPPMRNGDTFPQIHYHANVLSQDPEIRWVRAIELLKYAAYHGEMDIVDRGSKKHEGKTVLLARKLTESKQMGLYDAIKVYGVLEPILIVPESAEDEEYPEGYIFDGYHRLAAAIEIDRNMLVPVKEKDW